MARATPTGTGGRDTGDRAGFLARLQDRLHREAPATMAHPMPGPLARVPIPVSSALDPGDLVGSFIANARTAAAVVHDVDGGVVPDDLLDAVVERHRVGRAVVTDEPEARAVGERLAARGVAVDGVTTSVSARADLGVTGAVRALATTGTLVLDSGVAGGRTASLLPPAHLCVLPAARIVASTTDVLRPVGRPLPSNLLFVTGPSRSGDIEQIITLGVHGPLTVEIAVLRDATG